MQQPRVEDMGEDKRARFLAARDRAQHLEHSATELVEDIPPGYMGTREVAAEIVQRAGAVAEWANSRLSELQSQASRESSSSAAGGDRSEVDSSGLQAEAKFAARGVLVAIARDSWGDPVDFHSRVMHAWGIEEHEYAPPGEGDSPDEVTVTLPTNLLAQIRKAAHPEHGSNDDEHDLLGEVADAMVGAGAPDVDIADALDPEEARQEALRIIGEDRVDEHTLRDIVRNFGDDA